METGHVIKVVVEQPRLEMVKSVAAELREGIAKLSPLEKTVGRKQIAEVTRLINAVEAL